MDMATSRMNDPQPSLAHALRNYAEVALMVAASTVAGLLIAPAWGSSAVDLLYLPPVLAAASLYGLRPALFACLLATLAYNFYFTAPVHSFQVDRPTDVLTIALLFAVALVTSQLAAAMRRQARLARAHAERQSTIAGFARSLLSGSTEAAIGDTACRRLADLFDCNVVLVAGLPEPAPVARYPDGSPLTPGDMAAAAIAGETGTAAGRGTHRLDPANWRFEPVRSETRVLAALGLARDDGEPPVAESQQPLLASLLDQLALSLDRVRLEAEMRALDGIRERDRLRGALLSSVGHDLRTPLTAIIAGADELRRELGPTPLVATISAEAKRLERYIANLLDMARIEAGALKLGLEPIDLVDAVAAALRDLGREAQDRVATALDQDLPLVTADPILLHHILINLIDNALRHGGAGAAVWIIGTRQGAALLLSVEDDGPGLDAASGAAFDRFKRIGGSDRKGGAGLGLSIVKAFAESMGAEVGCGPSERLAGAAFRLVFPAALVREPVNAG
jgi:two-component system sensor histidine kinase KdpD